MIPAIPGLEQLLSGSGAIGKIISEPFTGNKATAKAVKAQAYASMRALKYMKDQYAQQKALQDPFIQGGYQSFGLQGALSGLQGNQAQQQAFADFMAAQQGAVQSGMPQMFEGAPAGLSQALAEYGRGVAMQDYDNYYNRLGMGAGMGQGSASALGGIGTDVAGGIANILGQQGENMANAALAQGQARAQGMTGLSNLLGAGISAYGNYQNQQRIDDRYTKAMTPIPVTPTPVNSKLGK